ncbi:MULTISPECIES: hypothetical protein [unclassified Pseudoxanthomonas]|uniref:hypothetical protein n=1 Tax=unclassified Pseudoxanthomonas TaxID=2645906 RepID=UPI0008E4CDE4|nr:MULTISPECIES: hypothetical protein [unclassified Pseudoxanthomonas]PPJ41626.1 hypothetical protein C0063_17590 [Pseudoxanthomonas sp. KAs_5_3]SFV32098.1 hypothetical protein SAMN05428990_2309 [Pseudoxanthomonas sp. YR558]
MTRNSRIWWLVGFLIALVGVGFPYWRAPSAMTALPGAFYGPGLAAIAVVAMMLRAFGTGRFVSLWLLIAAAAPVAVLLRMFVGDTAGTPVSWPRELLIASALGLAASLVGTLIGSLFLLRSSRRPT